MKYLAVIIMSVVPMLGANANEMSEFENHYREMIKLQNDLDKLRLEKEILALEVDISASRREMISSRMQSNQVISPDGTPFPTVSNAFNPYDAKLLYLLGTGASMRAIVSFRDVNYSFRSGQLHDGWRVTIDNKDVFFNKGSESVQL